MMKTTTTRDGEEEEEEKRQRNKNENETGVCARFLYNALSLTPSLNAPHVPRNIPSQGNVRRIPVLAG